MKNFRKVIIEVIPYGIIFFAVLFFLFPLLRRFGFGDGDMFYHLKMTLLFIDYGFQRGFPWLPYTSLRDFYIDHHFGYHVALIPFVKIFGPLFGAKVFHILSIWFISVLIYYGSKKYSGSNIIAFFCAILPLTSILFVARIGIEKAAASGVALSLLYILVLFSGRLKLIFFLSFFYVFWYGGWPLVLVFSFIWSLILFSKEKSLKAWREFFYALVGVILALIIHPSFPGNLVFYYEQIIKIAFLNDIQVGPIASEWIGFDSILPFICYITFPLLCFIVGILSVIIQRRRNISPKLFFMVIITFLFFLFTIKARRMLEYFIPYASFLFAFVWADRRIFLEIFHDIADKYRLMLQRVFMFFIFICFCVAGYGYYSSALWITDREDYYFGFDVYKGASLWLLENVPSNEIIVNMLWEEFPQLFFHDSEHRYISGLDPRFLIYGNKDIAQRYYSLPTLSDDESIYFFVRDQLHSSYIIVNNKIEYLKKFNERLSNSSFFQEAYNDSFIIIYKLAL